MGVNLVGQTMKLSVEKAALLKTVQQLSNVINERSTLPILSHVLLEAKENRLSSRSFDGTGNFSFGIKEYIDVPGMEYDPKIGILGMDVCVTLERPGYRVKRKRLGSKIGKNHVITKQDAMEFMKENFGVAIE